MEITRIFFHSRLESGDSLSLPHKEKHHVHKVLRGRGGDRIEIVDSAGRLFVAELAGDGAAQVLEERFVSDCLEGEIVLYQAIPKGGRMDLVVEKATELGVGRIVPLYTERSVVKLSEQDGKVGRWRRVVEAAARQSLRLQIPEVTEAVSFLRVVREEGERGVLLHNEAGLPPLEDTVTRGEVCLFVGPEGGFSEGEVEAARAAGLSLASLGPYRLRSETAGIAAVARASAVFGRTKTVRRSR